MGSFYSLIKWHMLTKIKNLSLIVAFSFKLLLLRNIFYFGTVKFSGCDRFSETLLPFQLS